MKKTGSIFILLIMTGVHLMALSASFISLESGLRLRKGPGVGYGILKTVERGALLQFVRFGKKEVIDHRTGNWIRVRSADGVYGWVFGGYLNRLLSFTGTTRYSLIYPEKWAVNEEVSNGVTYLQITSYDKRDDLPPGTEIPPDSIKITLVLYSNISSSAEQWARSLSYIRDVQPLKNQKYDTAIGTSKTAYGQTVLYKIMVHKQRGVIITWYPPESIYRKAAENCIAAFRFL